MEKEIDEGRSIFFKDKLTQPNWHKGESNLKS